MPAYNLDDLKRANTAGSAFVPDQGTPEPEDPRGSPAWYEQIGSYLLNNNWVAGTFAGTSEALTRLTEAPDENFDTMAQIKGTDLEPYAMDFIGVYNQPQFDRRAQEIRGELADRDIISRSPLYMQLFAGVINEALDPINYIPFAGPMSKGIKSFTRMETAKRYAYATGKAAVMTTVGQEALLQSQQRFRTFEDSAFAIAVSAPAGAILGGALGALAAPGMARRARARDEFEAAAAGYMARRGGEAAVPDPAMAARAGEVAPPGAAMRETGEPVPGVLSISEDGVGRPVYRRDAVTEPVTPVSRETPEPAAPRGRPAADPETSWSMRAGDDSGEAGSLSAARAPETDVRLAGGRVRGAIVEAIMAPSRKLGIFGKLFDNPVGRALTSVSRGTRAATEKLANVMRLTKNQDEVLNGVVTRPGVATAPSVESSTAWGRGLEFGTVMAGKREYTAYRGALAGNPGTAGNFADRVKLAAADLVKNRPAGVMSEAEFKAAAYDVVRDGIPHGDKHVNALAEEITRALDLLQVRAIEAGVLDPNVDPVTAKNYIMRVYDRPMITAERRTFEAIVKHWMKDNAALIEAEAVNARKAANDAQKTLMALMATLSPDDMRISLQIGQVREAEIRASRADKVFDEAVAAYHAATDRLRALESVPDARTRKDVVDQARGDALVIQDEMMLAMKEREAAMASLAGAKNTLEIYENTLKKWPGRLKRAIVERRMERLRVLRTQANAAERQVRALADELATARSAQTYAEWLRRRAETKPPGVRPMSLVEHITSRGKNGKAQTGVRIWVRDAEGNKVVTSEGGDYLNIVKNYLKKIKSGDTDARARINRLISDDEDAPTVGHAAEQYRSFSRSAEDDGGMEDTYTIDEFLRSVEDDLAAISDGNTWFGSGETGKPRRSHEEQGRRYDTNEMDDVAIWAEWDWARERKAELATDEDFKAGRAVTQLVNRWRAKAAHRLKGVQDEIAKTAKERDDAQAWLNTEAANARQLDKARRDLRKQLESETKRADDLEAMSFKSPEEIDRIVREMTSEMLAIPGMPTARGMDAEMGVKRRGPLADRTLLIPDTYDAGMIEVDGVMKSGRFDQFVVKDTDRVMAAVIRNMVPDIELHRAFGSVDLAAERQRISLDYADLRGQLGRQQRAAMWQAIPEAQREALEAQFKTQIGMATGAADRADIQKQMEEALAAAVPEKARAKIQKRFQKLMARTKDDEVEDLETLAAQVARVRGTFAGGVAPDSTYLRFAENAKALNQIRLMGKAVFYSASDAAMIWKSHGGPDFWRAMRFAVSDPKAFSEELQRIGPAFGQAVDVALSIRTSAIADMDSQFVPTSKAERALHWTSQRFGLANLLGPMTDFWKGIDVMVAQNRMLRNIEAVMDGKGISPAETAYMRDHFIGDAEMALIATQRSKWKTVGALRMAEVLDWDNDAARRLFQAAIDKDASFNVITPGLDKPIWMSTATGSLLAQFKSFTFVAMSRTIVSGLQEGDARAAAGLGILLTGGALSFIISSLYKGEDPFSQPIERWAVEAVDRSALFGYLGEVNAFADKMGVGLNAQLGGRELTRYTARSAAEQILGPTFGAAWNLLNIAPGALSGDIDMSGGDLGRLRSMVLPNLFYAEWLGDAIERGVANSLGIPQRDRIKLEPEPAPPP